MVTMKNVYINVPDNRIVKDKGENRLFDINGRKYLKILLPKGTNFSGITSKNNKKIYQVEGGSFLVPVNAVSFSPYQQGMYMIKLSESYQLQIDVDLGKTGEKLENGKDQHHFERINVSPLILKDSLPSAQWMHFSITEKMKKDYTREDGEQRSMIFIPNRHEGELSGCFFIVSAKCVRHTKKEGIYSVSVHRDNRFNVLKSIQTGVNAQNRPIFENKVIKSNVSANELQQYYTFEQQEQQVSQIPVKPDHAKKEIVEDEAKDELLDLLGLQIEDM